MRILALCGSPHQGNCHSVLTSIQESFPAVDHKLLMLSELNLEPCRRRYVCIAGVKSFVR